MFLLDILKRTIKNFTDDNGLTLSAALAFYGIFSIAPLLFIIVSLTGFLGFDTQNFLVEEAENQAGPAASKALSYVFKDARQNIIAGGISIGISSLIFLFTATRLFNHLQKSMSIIFDQRTTQERIIWQWIKKRLLSLLMILICGGLIMAAIIINSALSAILADNSALWQVANVILSMIVFTVLFAAVFSILNRADLFQRHIWIGSVITAVLFSAGNFAIGKYIYFAKIAKTYGAAGSLVVLLLWIYYSSIILFFGAESIKAYYEMYSGSIQKRS